MSNISHFLEQIMMARYGKDVRQSIHDAIQEIDAVADTAQNSATASAKEAADTLNMTVAVAESTKESETNAAESAVEAESYAHGGTGTRTGEDTDCAMYYYQQAKDISKGMNGLIPMGTITFAELSNEDNQVDKFMFNISNNFVTDDTFKEGSGHEYPAGVNVYRTSDGYWDCLAGNFVAGVRGAKELTPRQGFVVLTPENIGALPDDGDSAENTVAFTSEDAEDSEENPLAWTDVDILESGEKHSSILHKISVMFRNIRYLFKVITAQNDALASLNTNLNNLSYYGHPDPVIGPYGSYVNVKACNLIKDNIGVLIFSGQVTGTIDIMLTAFGINSGRMTSSLLPDGGVLASAEGLNGGTLYVRCYPRSTAIQLRSDVDNDNYTVMIPIILE